MSKALDSLKKVKEQLGHNYTSYQLLSVLDSLLWKSLWPIIESTEFFDRILANVLGWGATNPRRKLSSLPKERFNTYVVAYLAADDPKLKLRILKRMRIERNILFFTVSRFLMLAKDAPATRPSPELTYKLAIVRPNKFWFSMRETLYWSKHAVDFKGMILEKYMRLVMVEASTFFRQQQMHNPHLVFDIEDMAQNFMLAVNRAVDKCDAHQGTLTAYVQTWLRDAKSNPNSRGEYGVAYTIPASQRRRLAGHSKTKAVNISVSIESSDLLGLVSDSDTEAEYEREKSIDHIKVLAKRADPHGIGRLFLGIGERFDTEEIKTLETLSSSRQPGANTK